MEKILVIIPVINLWERYTKPCIRSFLANKTSVPMDIVVIDNGSTDETGKDFDAFGEDGARVTVIRNEENRGCGGGWNQGLAFGKEHGYTHFVIANNDILVGPGAVEALYEKFKDGGTLLVSSVDVSGELPVPEMILDPENEVNKKEFSFAPHPNFSNFMIGLDTLERVGIFDEVFFPAYFEDNDYHHRLKLAGGEHAGIAITTSVFYHFGSRTQNEAIGSPVVPGNLFERNRSRFISKWGGNPGGEVYATPYNDPDKDLKHVG